MAFGKLQGFITGAPVTWKGQNLMNFGAFGGAIVLLIYQVIFLTDAPQWMFFTMVGTGFSLGVLAVLPIGGADMPVVISLLNSYAGLAACATGFALRSNILIISGALDGSSGLLLSIMMSKAMNRSFSNVLFGAFGTGDSAPAASTRHRTCAKLQRRNRRRRRCSSRRQPIRDHRSRLWNGCFTSSTCGS